MSQATPTNIGEIHVLQLSVKRLQMVVIAMSLLVVTLILVTFVVTAVLMERSQIVGNASSKEQVDLSNKNVALDHESKRTIYANFARVSGTTEEVIVDLGINTKVGEEVQASELPVSQTVVMNFHTAKRFAAALQIMIERYEKAVGNVDLDSNE